MSFARLLRPLTSHSEPWYAGYGLQGLVILGTMPILLPVIVANAATDAATGAAQAGLVVGMFYAGQLSAPLWGALADGLRAARPCYLAGYVFIALGLAGVELAPSLSGLAGNPLTWWVVAALAMGVGSAGSNTVAAMFIMEHRPKSEWDERIGWLQTCYGLGQALGLGLAAWLATRPDVGMWASAALMAPALVLGALRMPPERAAEKADEHPAEQAARRAEVGAEPVKNPAGHQHLFSLLAHVHRPHIGRLLANFVSAYGLFILAWFGCMLGMWLIFNLYPLLMRSVFGVSESLSSVYYAITAGVGVFLYAPSGTLAQRLGARMVVFFGFVLCLASCGGMWAIARFGHVEWVAAWQWLVLPVVFGLLPVAWSPLIVGGTALAGELGTGVVGPEGTALGVFNAAIAVASVLAAFGAGLLAHQLGYGAILLVATACCVAGCVLFVPLFGPRKAQRG